MAVKHGEGTIIPVFSVEECSEVDQLPHQAILYRRSKSRTFVYWLGVVLSGGLLLLLTHWLPSWRRKLTYAVTREFSFATKVLLLCKDRSVAAFIPCKHLQVWSDELRRVLPCLHDDVKGKPLKTGGTSSNTPSTGSALAAEDHVCLHQAMADAVAAITASSVCGVSHSDTVVFDYKCTRFVFNVWCGMFENVSLQYRLLSPRDILQRYGEGLKDDAAVRQRLALFGPNSVAAPMQPLHKLVQQQLLHPFYFFQVAAIGMWLADGYYQYAYAVLFITTVSLCDEIYEMRRAQLKLNSLARLECSIEVLRNSTLAAAAVRSANKKFSEVKSTELVPGDVFRLTRGMILPCDALLLAGTAIVNEAMLTGESVPIVKTNLVPRDDTCFGDYVAKSASLLYGGTEVVDVRDGACGLVLKTGFSTAQGQMIRTVLHPPPSRQSDFRCDTYKSLLLLAVVAAIAAALTVVVTLARGFSGLVATFRALDVFPIAVPPALPATMSVGSSLAVTKLRRLWNVMCLMPAKINVAGQVSTVVFDKTGTLTEDDLTVDCVVPVVDNNFASPVTEGGVASHPLLQAGLATCHGLCTIDGIPRGDPLELELLRFSNANFTEVSIAGAPVLAEVHGDFGRWQIRRRFEFSAALQRMSVVARSSNIEGGREFVFCKGSPERVLALCLPETIPNGFQLSLQHYTTSGMRVLAAAHRQLSPLEAEKLTHVEREAVECQLTLSGLIVVGNKLKPATSKTVGELRASGVRCIMATGDNALTAAAVAREANIIDSTSTQLTLLAEVGDSRNTGGQEDVVVWSISQASAASYRLLRSRWSSMVQLSSIAEITAGGNPSFSPNKSQQQRQVQLQEITFTTDRLPFLLSGFDPRRIALVISGPAFQSLSAVHHRSRLSWAELDLPKGPSCRMRRCYPPRNSCLGSDGSASRRSSSSPLIEASPFARRQSFAASSKSYHSPKFMLTAKIEPDGGLSVSHLDSLAVEEQSAAAYSLRTPSLLSNQSASAAGVCRTVTFSTLEWVLRFGRVFARMTPDDKASLVTALQNLPHEPLVGMCGDGANDCAALRVADVGISLSEKEASLAAPFTSTLKSVASVSDILREGRGALVNSFQSFKFLALYAVLQLTCSLLLYLFGTNFADPQYLWVDLCITLPLSFTMAWTGSSRALTSELPDRHLLGYSVLLSLGGQWFIQFTFLAVALGILLAMPWYTPYVPDTTMTHFSSDDLASYENTTVFVVANYQFIFLNVALACGRPWRKAPLTNYFYSAFVIALLFLSTFGFLFPVRFMRWLPQWAGIVDLPHTFRIALGALILLNICATLLFERIVIAKWVYSKVRRYEAGSQYIDVLLPLTSDAFVRFVSNGA